MNGYQVSCEQCINSGFDAELMISRVLFEKEPSRRNSSPGPACPQTAAYSVVLCTALLDNHPAALPRFRSAVRVDPVGVEPPF
jgi:hypothetical protein